MAAYSKKQLIDHIQAILKVYELNPQGEKSRSYKIKTFKNLIAELNKLNEQQVQDVAQDTMKIRGIGDSSRTLMQQFLTTGTSDRYEELQIEKSTLSDTSEGTSIIQQQMHKQESMAILEGIHGVGQKTAGKWYDLGIRSLGDLYMATERKVITLTHQQQIGYYYYHHLALRIPRAEMDLLAGRIQELLASSNKKIIYEICGSYRRGSTDSGDIDVLVQNNGQYGFEEVISAINSDRSANSSSASSNSSGNSDNKFIVAILTPEAKKVYMAVCRLSQQYPARRIDIKMAPNWAWGTALLHYTGPDNLNKSMRDVAIGKNLRLSEYGLYTFSNVHQAYASGQTSFLIGLISPDNKHIHMAVSLPSTRGLSFLSDTVLQYNSREQLSHELQVLIEKERMPSSIVIYERFHFTPNEEAVFEILGLEYLSPVQRQAIA